MWHAWGRREVFTGFRLGSPKVTPLGRPRQKWENNIKMDLREKSMGRTGFSWLRIGSV